MGGLLVFYETIGISGFIYLSKQMIKSISSTDEEEDDSLASRSTFTLLPIVLMLAACGHVIIGVSEIPWMFYVGLTLGSVSVVAHVILNTIVALESSLDHQGFAITSTEALFSLASLGGSAIANNLFGIAIDSPSVPSAAKGIQFFVTAVFWTFAAGLAIGVTFTKAFKQRNFTAINSIDIDF